MPTAAPDYTTDGSTLALIGSVYRHTLAPNARGVLTEDDIMALLDEELRTTILPLVLAAQEEFYVQNYDQAVVMGQYDYTIPKRASFATWRDVVFVDPNGNEINMTNLAPEYVKITYPAGGMPPLYTFGFILQNDKVRLWPPQGSLPTNYQLRMKIKRRPNNLTSVDNCGQITAIDTLTGQVTLSNSPDGWNTADTFDIIPNSPQFTSRGDDLTVSSVAGNILIFDDLPSDVAVGDWVCPAMMSCVPQIPYDLFPALVQRGVIRLLEALGDSQPLQVAERRYQDMAVDFARTVSPRVDGTTKKIVSRNTPSWWGALSYPFSR